MIKKIILIITVYIFIKIFINYQLIQKNIINISIIFFKNIFPSLFVFFIISNILINYNIVKYIYYIFGPILKNIFHLNPYTSYVLIMSLFTGIPSNAKYIKELLDNNLITKEEGQNVLLFTHFANPLFILSIAPTKPLLIILSHYIPNFIIGLFLKKDKKINNYEFKINSKSFIDILLESINKAFNTLFIILGLIIIFYIISSLTDIFVFKCILEMSSAIFYLLPLNIDLKIKTMIIGGIISFGGLCSHMQVFSILQNKKIRYYPYLLARIIHFCLTTLIIYLMY